MSVERKCAYCNIAVIENEAYRGYVEAGSEFPILHPNNPRIKNLTEQTVYFCSISHRSLWYAKGGITIR